MATVEVLGVRKVWRDPRRKREVVALDNIDLTIRTEEFVCVLGPSGCGKSTLLYLLAGLEATTAGVITVAGVPVTGPSWERGMVFQDHALFPWRTVAGNIAFGLQARGIPVAQRQRIVAANIELIGLQGFEDAFPAELSGGMQQRVGIARVLANDPKVLLMDEPFGSLDSQTRQAMQAELLRIWDRTRKTVVFITHDIAESVFLADRVVVMSPRPGRIQAVIPIELPRPRRRTEARFVRYCERLEAYLFESPENHNPVWSGGTTCETTDEHGTIHAADDRRMRPAGSPST